MNDQIKTIKGTNVFLIALPKTKSEAIKIMPIEPNDHMDSVAFVTKIDEAKTLLFEGILNLSQVLTYEENLAIQDVLLPTLAWEYARNNERISESLLSNFYEQLVTRDDKDFLEIYQNNEDVPSKMHMLFSNTIELIKESSQEHNGKIGQLDESDKEFLHVMQQLLIGLPAIYINIAMEIYIAILKQKEKTPVS